MERDNSLDTIDHLREVIFMKTKALADRSSLLSELVEILETWKTNKILGEEEKKEINLEAEVLAFLNNHHVRLKILKAECIKEDGKT